jgi:hypothetical protein
MNGKSVELDKSFGGLKHPLQVWEVVADEDTDTYRRESAYIVKFEAASVRLYPDGFIAVIEVPEGEMG